MAMMNVLAELHQEPELKLNLKFEIEVLCKNLNLDVNVSTQKCYWHTQVIELGVYVSR